MYSHVKNGSRLDDQTKTKGLRNRNWYRQSLVSVLTGPHDYPRLTLALFLSATSRKWINKHKTETLPLQPWICLDFLMEKDLWFPNLPIFKEISSQHPEGQNIFFRDTIKQHILKVPRVTWIYSHTVPEIHLGQTACIHKETAVNLVPMLVCRALQLLLLWNGIPACCCKSQLLIVTMSTGQWHP